MLDIDEFSFTPSELRAIEILTCGHKVVRYRELIKYVWCCEWEGDLHAMRVLVSRMRKKLKPQNYDIALRNGGYMLVAK